MKEFELITNQTLIHTRTAITTDGREGGYYPGVQHLEALGKAYASSFAASGYTEHAPVPITSGFDPSVRFIGSHISVFKPYLNEGSLCTSDMVMVQNCIRTRNLNKLFDDQYVPKYGSFFTSLGGLARPDRLEQVCGDVFLFLQTELGLHEEDIKIKASSQDQDILTACLKYLPSYNLECDTEDLRYYQHKVGIEGIRGRNCNIALPSPISRHYEDIGNIIILELRNQVLGIEIALGDSTTLKQLYGLDHILDAYALNLPKDRMDQALQRKMEDALMTCTVLYQEGLRPGANHNQSRILRSYTKALAYYRHRAQMTIRELEDQLTYTEQQCLPTHGNVSSEIIEYVQQYDHQLTHEPPSNKEDVQIRRNLGGIALS